MRLFTSNRSGRQPRRGIILLVVIAMLTLFAALGLTFVYYAQAESDNARQSSARETERKIDSDPEFLLSYFLSQMLFGVDDKVESFSFGNTAYAAPHHGVYSALRGHDLGRNMFGYNRYALNHVPFNGVGRPKSFNDPDIVDSKGNKFSVERLVNHQFFPGDGALFKSFGGAAGGDFIRDPGRYGATNRNQSNSGADPSRGDDRFLNPYFGENVPYTYADLQNFYLGQLDASGNVIARSFWRDWTLDTAGRDSLDPTRKLWQPFDISKLGNMPEPWKKYATLRPIPWFNRGDPMIALDNTKSLGSTGFPAPADANGDVKNLEFGAGGNDSIWIDLGAPVRIGPDGRKYKPMFAVFITDLDGKVNINAAGNMRLFDGTNYDHSSGKGYTPSEINIKHVLPYKNAANVYEWPNLFFYPDANGVYGRYGADQRPGSAGTSWATGAGSLSPWYGHHDSDSVKNDPANENPPYPYAPVPQNKYYVGEKLTLPATHVGFPTLSKDTFQNGSNTGVPKKPGTSELYESPKLYQYFNPTSVGDRRFSIADMEAILRYQGTGSPSLSSELFRRLGQNLNDGTGDAAKKRWRRFTTDSMDLARPGITPWLYNSASSSYSLLTAFDANNPFPKVDTAISWPETVLGTQGNGNKPNSPNSGEFGYEYRGYADLMSAARLNLQARAAALTAYPAPDAEGRIDTTDINLATAINDRQQFAKDIFDRLRWATTGARPGDVIDKTTLTPEQYNALGWLAQLAANMVDFLDADEIPTVFYWDTNNLNGSPPSGFVVGTELPRLTINEVLVQATNDPDDPLVKTDLKASMPYKVNFWVELINPMLDDPVSGKLNTVRLQVPPKMMGPKGWAAYKLTILDQKDANIRDRDRVTGKPDPNKIKLEVAEFDPTGTSTMDDPAHYTVQALNQKLNGTDGLNDGFYVLGPEAKQTFPVGPNPMPAAPTPTLRVKDQNLMDAETGKNIRCSLTYEIPLDTANAVIKNIKPTILLRRLANPHLAYDGNPANQTTFNPYITVDYVEDAAVFDGVDYDSMGANAMKDQIVNRAAKGRKQPWAAHSSQQISQNPGNMDTAQHTFFKHNDQRANPFDWLPHLDRTVVSPTELTYVSAFRPHELTQQFITGNAATNKHNHTASWASSAHRLYRFLEFVDAGWRMQGVSQNGRIPGKININTIWDQEVFNALCDANNSTYFTQAQIGQVWTSLLSSRTKNSTSPGQNDLPFTSLASPFNANTNAGVDATIFRQDPTRNDYNGNKLRLLEIDPGSAANDHPAIRLELANKIFNNVTTRSNTFAVWVTVGFFEVFEWPNDPDPKLLTLAQVPNWVNLPGGTHFELGKEIGRDENRHVRHRMFAIIDRTGFMMPKNLARLGGNVISDPKNPQTVDIDLSNNPIKIAAPFRTEYNFYPQAGMILDVDSGASRETIQITNVDYTKSPPKITAVFKTAHAAGTIFSVPADQSTDVGGAFSVNGQGYGVASPAVHGNPGPQPRFDHRQHIGLVPYYSIIQ